MDLEYDERSKLKCFVVSTIGEAGSKEREDADLVLDYLIRPALGEKYQVTRSDEDSNPGAITPQIVESILEADLVIADLSGFNPNVYYEVAIAHGYERPTVHLQVDSEKPAFDLKDMRLVRYNVANPRQLERAVEMLAEFAAYAVANPEKVRTPLSGAKQFLQIEESGDPIAQSNLEIIDQIRRLRGEVQSALPSPRLENRSADIRSLRTIIERARRGDRLEVQDLEETITQATSTEFDEWVRGIASKITGQRADETLNRFLFDLDLRSVSGRDGFE